MIIILPLGRSVKQYLQWVGGERKNMALHCPSCSCLRLHGHDHYERRAVTRLSLRRIPIHRWRCPQCQRVVSVLPDLLVPYGRFVNNLRERAVRLVVKGETLAAVPLKVSSPAVSVVSTRTVRRWVRRAEGLAADLSNWLVELILQALPHLDIYALSPRYAGTRANLRFLLDIGAHWCRLFPSPLGAHPGFFAALSRCSSAPGFL